MFNPDHWLCPGCGSGLENIVVVNEEYSSQVNLYGPVFSSKSPGTPLTDEYIKTVHDNVHDEGCIGYECQACTLEFSSLVPAEDSIDKALFEAQNDPAFAELISVVPEGFRMLFLQPNGSIFAGVNAPLPSPGGWIHGGPLSYQGTIAPIVEHVPEHMDQITKLYRNHTEHTMLGERFLHDDLDRYLWTTTYNEIVIHQAAKTAALFPQSVVNGALYDSVVEARQKVLKSFTCYKDEKTGVTKIDFAAPVKAKMPESDHPLSGSKGNEPWWKVRSLIEMSMVTP